MYRGTCFIQREERVKILSPLSGQCARPSGCWRRPRPWLHWTSSRTPITASPSGMKLLNIFCPRSQKSKHGGSSQSRGEGHGRRRGRLVEVADHGILGGRGEAAGEARLDQVGGDDEGAEERNIAMEEAPTDLLSCFRLRA